jgi:hypothetical protein
LSHENEKLCSFFTSQTLGNIVVSACFSAAVLSLCSFSHFCFNSISYSADNFEIIGPQGYPSHIILATLSKASPPASSQELPSFSISHIEFIEYMSLCPHETVRQINGNFISSCFLSKKFAKMCPSI